MYTTEEIEAELIIPSSFKPNNGFIGFIVAPDDNGVAEHSGLLITYGNKSFLFHYLPSGISLDLVDVTTFKKSYFKEITIIDKQLIPSFLTHCKIIKPTAKPSFGFFYAGSYYENGDYHSNDNTPQLMTCVGFCINVLTGFIEKKSYIEFSDWVSVSQAAQDWLDNFLIDFKKEFPAVDEGTIRKNLRRIKPSELISSGYFNALPIRKIQTDSIKLVVEQIFKGSI